MLIHDFKKLKSTNASLRRYLIACLVLVIVLSISNLGTAMAAAYLAKETKISSSGNLETMDGGAVSTVGRSGLVISRDMGNLHRDVDYMERRALSEQDGDLFLGCITDEMAAQIQGSASSGSTVMVFDQIADGASTYHQLIGDGMSTDGKKAVYRCSSMPGGISIEIDENGYCEDSRRRLVERGLFNQGDDMMAMRQFGHDPLDR